MNKKKINISAKKLNDYLECRARWENRNYTCLTSVYRQKLREGEDVIYGVKLCTYCGGIIEDLENPYFWDLYQHSRGEKEELKRLYIKSMFREFSNRQFQLT